MYKDMSAMAKIGMCRMPLTQEQFNMIRVKHDFSAQQQSLLEDYEEKRRMCASAVKHSGKAYKMAKNDLKAIQKEIMNKLNQ